MTPASRVMIPVDIAGAGAVGLIWIFQSPHRTSHALQAFHSHGLSQVSLGCVLVALAALLLVGFVLRSTAIMAITLGAGAAAYAFLAVLVSNPPINASQTGPIIFGQIAAAWLATMLTLSFPQEQR